MKKSRPNWVGQKSPFGRNWAWTHPKIPGVAVKHCGHPTALRPYHIVGNLEHDGQKFRLLVDAQARAEQLADEQRLDQLGPLLSTKKEP